MTNESQESFKGTARLTGKVALVTGSGTGIGRAIALRFAQEGAKLMIGDVNRSKGEATVKTIKDAGDEATFILVDVSKAADAEKMVKTTIQVYGKLDILVNNAGIWLGKPLIEVSEQEWDRLMSINMKGAFLCSKYTIPEMAKRGGGVIINLSSMGGIVGSAGSTAYCASKGGVLLLTKAMAEELKPAHIRVNALCPVLIDTDMAQRVIEDLNINIATTSQGRIGTPEDVANAALFLASDESAFITGYGLPLGSVGSKPQN